MPKVIPLPTTDETLVYALKRSLITQGVAKDTGTTVGDFIDAILALPRVTRETPLAAIEYGVKTGSLGYVIADFDHDGDNPNGGVFLREV